MILKERYLKVRKEAEAAKALLVAVSKTKPVEDIHELYLSGQRDFGENYVQELVEKQHVLPKDINWHFIGHLQTNKVKYIAPFINLIQSADSKKILYEINRQAKKNNRIIDVLLQVFIASEETKFGFDGPELETLAQQWKASDFPGIRVRGLMGMASFTENHQLINSEYSNLRSLYETCSGMGRFGQAFNILSMGMSNDYHLALKNKSNLLRIGSLIFGERK